MNRFRLLTADEIECRVSTIKEKGLSLLLYKTARTDANLLDETVGEENWSNDFKLIDGVLYGGICVDYGQGGVWKWDAGVESNTEAEKGRASDAFKRAGFKHGIGRELYTAPFIWISSDKCEISKNPNGKLACYDTFEVGKIAYNEKQEICGLEIWNKKSNKRVFLWAKGDVADEPYVEPEKKHEDDVYTPKCVECGKEISVKVHDWSVRNFKKPLCIECQKIYGSANR